MQGQYITHAAFQAYQNNEMDSALGVLDTNLRNENLRNQVAARLLGFSSYEALQPMFNHEWNLFNTIYFEQSCPYQGGRPVLRHRNLLVAFDFDKRKIYGRVLCTGEERDFVAHWNANWAIDLPSDISFDPDPGWIGLIPEADGHYRAKIKFKGDAGFSLKVDAFVNKEGMRVDCKMDDGSLHFDPDGMALGYKRLDFKDCIEQDAMTNVNQAALKFESGEPCADKSVYQWKLKTLDDYNTPRLLSLGGRDWDDERMAPTELIFHSIAEARRFPIDNELDYTKEDFEGLVLCRVDKHVV